MWIVSFNDYTMNQNTEFERFVQRVYQKLVNNDVLKPTIVQHNAKIKGKSGCEHQIDVYWEYEIAGNKHQVAIECKNYDSLVPVGKVRDFRGVLTDLNNINGIMVSRKGYQKGAIKYASEYGISLKTIRRPEVNEMIGTITTVIRAEIRHTLFLIDEEWITENHFDIERIRNFYINLERDKTAYWHKASYFPIELKNNIIRDAEGTAISSLENLEKQLPENPEPGTSIAFSFDNGWIESRYWGAVRIQKVKFEYESQAQETSLNLAADDFVEAILEDAIDSNAKYIPKC